MLNYIIMENYLIEQINEINSTLDNFISNKKIIKEEVEKVFDSSSKKILEKQIRTLNDGRLLLEDQRIIFGAFRTIKNVTESMHSALLKAEELHENPTTAEKCKEIMPPIFAVVNEIARYDPYDKSDRLENVFNFSRILRKKAKNMGFSKSIDEELKELRMEPEEIKEFVDKLNETIQNRLEI